ncbi:neprilysin-like isoform X2 [Daphnia pulex]|uniref:neprilysin-like isoform X2 n=1 Tax=Daphnia pulex TaxID=6669 RepID=UPI001EDDF50A|nr:neprilysin-like isoform X2 [Daphnia pulex]
MEIAASDATLVSVSPVEDVKIKRSRKTFLIGVGAVIGAVVFIIATSLLADQVIRSWKELVDVRQELHDTIKDHQSYLKKEEPAVCWTKECILSAAALMESMDETADPCQDFYQFACGGWKKKNVIPRGSDKISQIGILDDRIQHFIQEFFKENSTRVESKPVNNTRDMYRACLDTDAIDQLGITPFVKILDSYGQWPMTVSNWTEDRFDWRKATASVRNTFGLGFLFEVSNFVDAKDTEFSTIYLDQPSLGLPSFVLKGNNLTSFPIQAYLTFISGVAHTIRDAIGGGANNDTDITKDIEDLISFHIEMANILTPEEDRSQWNLTRIYNPFSLPELQIWTDEANATEAMSQINWHKHLTDIYSAANVSINSDEKIVVIELEYLQRLVQLLDQTTPRVIANFIHWRLILENIYDVNFEMENLAVEFEHEIYGPFPSQPREDWCMKRVHKLMGFAIGAKYVESAFDPQAKIDMMEMILNLKMAFSSLVEESDWMDEETKINALDKAAAMKEYIGYPDWITNRTTLELAYQGIKTKPDKHFDNFYTANQFMVVTNLRFLRFRTNRENLWISFPAVVNAFYYPMFNSITFPAGILQPPFYGKGRLKALNYGAIGSVIGHEITHGFDDEGHKSDKKGHERSWWTNQTLDEFYKRKQCIIDQYSNYTLPELEGTDAFHINGIDTQGENIADNGGLREAFRAYQNYVSTNGKEKRLPGMERYTPEQLFFLSYANVWCSNEIPESLEDQVLFGVHTPPRYRIIGPLSNLVEFSEHFQCPVGSTMNQPNKCIVW